MCVCVWGGGGWGAVGGVSEFVLQRIQIYTFFFWGGGRGVEGVVWRGGSVARVSGFFLRRIHISKKKKKVLTSF